MDAQRQQVEVETALGRDHDLAVDHATLGQVGAQRLDELGEVARERLLVAAADLDVVAVAEDDGAEAVPLRLVEEVARLRLGSSRASFASIGDTGGSIGYMAPDQ